MKILNKIKETLLYIIGLYVIITIFVFSIDLWLGIVGGDRPSDDELLLAYWFRGTYNVIANLIA